MASLSFRKKLTYSAVLSGVFCLLLLVVGELALRVAGYGYETCFFEDAPGAEGTGYVRENRWCTAPFFSPQRVRRPEPFRLTRVKEAGVFRVFILGSSAAMGDPESSFSMARQLEVILAKAYPDIRFEIINAGVTAINSHLLRRYAEDCARLNPDLLIVYEGNNEVIGPFGPGTVFTQALESERGVALAWCLRASRLGQAVAALVRKDEVSTAAAWGGLQMFAQRQIAVTDPRLRAVEALFGANLNAIAEVARDVGAQCVLSTVIVNQRDFSPFLSAHTPGLSPEQCAAWAQCVAAGDKAFGARELAAAEASYLQALALDGQHAELLFKWGRLLLQQGRDAEARDALRRASDADTLRFRTDSRLNAAIRQLCAEKTNTCRLVDLEEKARQVAARGIPGDDLLYEHVHLNFSGTYLASRSFYDEISTVLLASRRIEKTVTCPVGIDEVRGQLAYTTYEQAMILSELIDRSSKPPFSAQADAGARVAALRERLERAAALLKTPGAVEALRSVYEQAIAGRPADWVLRRNYGMFLVAHADAPRALAHLREARRLMGDQPDVLFALAKALRATGSSEEAGQVASTLRQLEPRYPGLAQLGRP